MADNAVFWCLVPDSSTAAQQFTAHCSAALAAELHISWQDPDHSTRGLPWEQVKKMREAGYVLGNLDATIIAQKPKLSPHKVRGLQHGQLHGSTTSSNHTLHTATCAAAAAVTPIAPSARHAHLYTPLHPTWCSPGRLLAAGKHPCQPVQAAGRTSVGHQHQGARLLCMSLWLLTCQRATHVVLGMLANPAHL
jgi:hypothetical protein